MATDVRKAAKSIDCSFIPLETISSAPPLPVNTPTHLYDVVPRQTPSIGNEGGPLRNPHNDVNILLFVHVHSEQMLATAKLRNFRAAEKMNSQDNINP
jgi:hypothetical protein